MQTMELYTELHGQVMDNEVVLINLVETMQSR